MLSWWQAVAIVIYSNCDFRDSKVLGVESKLRLEGAKDHRNGYSCKCQEKSGTLKDSNNI